MKIRKILAIMMLIGIVGLTGCADKVSDDNVSVEENKAEEDIKKEPEEPEQKPEAKTDKEMIKEFLVGKWGNEIAFSDESDILYSMAYYTEFNEDGSIISHGYRNTDKGTFEIINKDVAIALFDHNFYEDPADPDNHDPIEGYVYEVIYHINYEEGTIEAEYSNEFHEMCISNAEDGILSKMAAEDKIIDEE